MTKRDLTLRISHETGLTQEEVAAIIQKALDHILKALAEGNDVEFRGFGTFEVKLAKARVGRNPRRPGTDVRVPARKVVRFKPGKELRSDVMRLTPQGAP